MAGPLGGIGGQQAYVANTVQQNRGDSQTQQTEQKPEENKVQQSSATETQGIDTDNQSLIEAQQDEVLRSVTQSPDSSKPRGSILDITV
jgi:hypothetical protein